MIISQQEEEVTNKDMASSSSSSSSSSPLSFWSLPDDMIVNCVARISRSYYPSLSLVSKSFWSLILSEQLKKMRSYLDTTEEYVCVCLQLPNHSLTSWYSLWIKKTQQTLTMDKQNSTGNYLVPMPSSSYTPWVPILCVRVGSQVYALGGNETPSSNMLVFNNPNKIWRKALSMTMPRSRAMNVQAVVLNEKIYVMGGCEKEESMNWAEVFDTKTQTWESLPDPGEELRFSLIKGIYDVKGKIYVKIKENEETMKHSFYDPDKSEWDIITGTKFYRLCYIENLKYSCDYNKNGLFWHNSKSEEWRMVMGLDLLKGYDMVEFVPHGKKLIIFLEGKSRKSDPNKKIWCAMVACEKRNDGEVWGQIEWTDIVLEVPQSSTILASRITWF